MGFNIRFRKGCSGSFTAKQKKSGRLVIQQIATNKHKQYVKRNFFFT